MDRQRHPVVFRSWRVERLRDPHQPSTNKPARQTAKRGIAVNVQNPRTQGKK